MRPFEYEQQKITEVSIQFYSLIGLLTVRFSEIESLVSHIMEKLINSDEDKIGYLLIENNNLDKNLDVLSQLNNIRRFKESEIKKIISELRALKKIRNSLVHGVWSDIRSNDENENYISCVNQKWVQVKQIPSYIKAKNVQMSSRYVSVNYTLHDLRQLTEIAEQIAFDLKVIWKKLQDIYYFD